MSLFISSLNSGSNGNCYYIGNEEEAVLIDAGISCRETEKRMNRLGLSMERVKAIFVSHEHSDHIRGIAVLAKKYQLPVYITSKTFAYSKISIPDYLVKNFLPYESIDIGSLSISAFPKFHDAVDPHSFIVSYKGVNVGVFTDIGDTCDHVISHFKKCHAAFLETNYDEDLLENGSYPFFLKRRIRGGMGHLSNRQALELFKAHRPAYMSHLLLSHLSKNNNCPINAQRIFNEFAGDVKIVLASRDQETEVFQINEHQEPIDSLAYLQAHTNEVLLNDQR